MQSPRLGVCALVALTLLVGAGCLSPQRATAEQPPNTLTEQELREGWILLFDGETMFGWRDAGNANWRVEDGSLAVSEGELGLLRTTSQFSNYELRADFRCAAETNSGILIRTSPVPRNATDGCYEVNIAPPDNPFPTGSIVGREKTQVEIAGDDQWHTFLVRVSGPTITVQVDGEQTAEFTDPAPVGLGYIGLQHNSGPVAFRNVKLRPLGMEPLFDGESLTGWRPYPEQKSEVTVTAEGEMQITDGPGQIETEAAFADFILQLEVFVDGNGLNSGIFFRNIPGEHWQGYESQIHNVYDGERTNPVDCGTGGFYRRQNARRIVADDHQWFHKTLVVTDNHMATWVNGIQVSDFSDQRPANENARRGFRAEAGTIALQGHDPTTSLRFREIRIMPQPARW